VSRTRGLTERGKARHALRLPAVERRESILEAALAVFGASSYASATTAAICDAAGISEPILYRHFGSKKELYVACLDESWRRLRTAWVEARDTAEPGDRLVAVSNATIELSAGGTVLPPTLWMQAFAEAGDDAEIRTAVRRVVADVHRVVAATIAGEQADGVINSARDAEAEAWVVVGSMLMHTMSARLGGLLRRADVERIRSQRMRWLTDGATPTAATGAA
jgi:AcrR family transcriptional regulator